MNHRYIIPGPHSCSLPSCAAQEEGSAAVLLSLLRAVPAPQFMIVMTHYLLNSNLRKNLRPVFSPAGSLQATVPLY